MGKRRITVAGREKVEQLYGQHKKGFTDQIERIDKLPRWKYWLTLGFLRRRYLYLMIRLLIRDLEEYLENEED